MDKLSLIYQYELGYLSQTNFYEQLLGSGQQLIAQEGLEWYVLYLKCESGTKLSTYSFNPYNAYDGS